jgi:outer membrane protein assembly factor BamB
MTRARRVTPLLLCLGVGCSSGTSQLDTTKRGTGDPSGQGGGTARAGAAAAGSAGATGTGSLGGAGGNGGGAKAGASGASGTGAGAEGGGGVGGKGGGGGTIGKGGVGGTSGKAGNAGVGGNGGTSGIGGASGTAGASVAGAGGTGSGGAGGVGGGAGGATSSEAVALQMDPAHSGAQLGEPMALPLVEAWHVDLANGSSYPLIAGGRVFVVEENAVSPARLVALDGKTGAVLWDYVVPTQQVGDAFATYEAGRVFLASSAGTQALDATTGAPLWSAAASSSSPPIAVGGRLYVPGGLLHVFDAATGALLQNIVSGPSRIALDASGLFGASPCLATRLDPTTLSTIWKAPRPCFGGGNAGVSLHEGRLWVLDPETASVVRDTSSGAVLRPFNAGVLPAFSGGRAYFVHGGRLHASDATTGTFGWVTGDDGLVTSPLVVGSVVHVGAKDGHLRSYDAATGGSVGSLDAGVPFVATPDLTSQRVGLAAADGVLVAPAGNRVVAYVSSAGAGGMGGAAGSSGGGSGGSGAGGAGKGGAGTGAGAVAFQIDAAHSGAQPSDTLSLPLVPRWKVELGGLVSYPLVVNGRVYATFAEQGGASLLALDASTGARVWGPVPLGTCFDNHAPISALAYDSGRVFAVDHGALVSAFDADTGVPSWATFLPDQLNIDSPPTAAGGRVFAVGSENGGTLYALDAATGAVEWGRSIQGGGPSAPVVTDDAVFTASTCTQADRFSLSGAPVWHFDLGCSGGGGQTPVLFDARLYTRDEGSNRVLTTDTGADYGQFDADAPPAFTGGRGYFTHAGSLSAMDMATGNVLWVFAGDGALVTAPLVVGSVVVVGSANGALFAVDAATGAMLSQDSVGTPFFAPDAGSGATPGIVTGLAEAGGVLVVPAGSQLIAYLSSGARWRPTHGRATSPRAPRGPARSTATAADQRVPRPWSRIRSPSVDGTTACASPERRDRRNGSRRPTTATLPPCPPLVTSRSPATSAPGNRRWSNGCTRRSISRRSSSRRTRTRIWPTFTATCGAGRTRRSSSSW